LKNVGSYQNSKCNIKPELLRIINENSFLKYFLSNCDDELLCTSLDFIKPQKSTGSLAALDDFTSDEYQDFIRLTLIEDELAIRTEPFPGILIDLYKEMTLPMDILNLLVEYYENLYNDDYFISILSMIDPSNNIVVNSNIKQYGRLRISADIYGFVQAAQHKRSAYILA
jgi:hypothetical protein